MIRFGITSVLLATAGWIAFQTAGVAAQAYAPTPAPAATVAKPTECILDESADAHDVARLLLAIASEDPANFRVILDEVMQGLGAQAL